MTILFIFPFLFIISKINSYKYFQANLLISGNLFLITDESIVRQDKDTNEAYLIYGINNNIEGEQFLKIISFAQFSSNDGVYIVCRYKNQIYLLFEEIYQINSILDDNIANYYCKIIPYKRNNENGHDIFIIAFINLKNKLNLIVYDINIQYYSYEKIQIMNM